MRQNDRGVPCQIRRDQLRQSTRSGRRDDHVQIAEQRIPPLDRRGADAVGVDVVHRWNEPGRAECIRPVEPPLLHQFRIAVAARQVIERRRGFGSQDDTHGIVFDIRQLYRDEPRTLRSQHGERGIVERLGGMELSLGVVRIDDRQVECSLYVADA